LHGATLLFFSNDDFTKVMVAFQFFQDSNQKGRNDGPALKIRPEATRTGGFSNMIR